MSTRKGANTRSRPQKHRNRTSFKNDLYGATPVIKALNNMHVSEVCEHCRDVIEWKIKYKKYKPLSQPKKCTKCGLRNVRKAYHVNCTDCALKLRCCAKCNKSADDVNILPPEPSPQEQMKLDQEMQLLIKKLPERKRRTFMRFMKKGKKKQREEGENGDSDPDIDSDNDEETTKEGADVEPVEKVKEKPIPYTKEELLKKLEQMKLALENGDEDFDDDFFGSDFDDDEEGEEEEDDDFDEEEDEEVDSEEEEEKPVEVKKKGVTFDKAVKK